jgi:glycosyltransferase involved in cell wall biosynthesis
VIAPGRSAVTSHFRSGARRATLSLSANEDRPIVTTRTPTDDPVAVTVVIAAHDAHATIARAIASLRTQTLPDWEAIVVADDGSDYAATLAAAGITDPRVRHVSSGGVATGCARARNVALPFARGAFLTRLDADDEFEPDRLAVLLPAARASGASTDMVRVVDDATGAEIRRTRVAAGTTRLDAVSLALLHCPLAPLVARDRAPAWFAETDIAEDVLHLFAVEDRFGPLAVRPEALYRYRVRAGSMCHGADAAARADRSYDEIEHRLATGAFAQLSAAAAARARIAIAAKRAFNRDFDLPFR